jgi:hypothetical protein
MFMTNQTGKLFLSRLQSAGKLLVFERMANRIPSACSSTSFNVMPADTARRLSTTSWLGNRVATFWCVPTAVN